MRFRKLVLEQFNVDPFTASSTIAGMCMHIYRKLFLPDEKSIAIVPHGGYRKHDKQSMEALKWLKCISKYEGLDIQHAGNGGEVRIRVEGHLFRVDGQLRTDQKTVYEYYGCVSL